ncbi:hypothetical protein [Paenibacillus silviterrae]|uniref:hypothetical protein n=1 Tax=Paenibacillus silviterrae TaxID=3242194 RepID=UPI002542A609|nr:hypothetical protein [Paenibacillus chinjuensis]
MMKKSYATSMDHGIMIPEQIAYFTQIRGTNGAALGKRKAVQQLDLTDQAEEPQGWRRWNQSTSYYPGAAD